MGARKRTWAADLADETFHPAQEGAALEPIEFTVPLRTGTGCNNREHWRARHNRVQAEHDETNAAWRQLPWKTRWEGVNATAARRPLYVTLTRISPGKPDDDNVAGAVKGVRDALAKLLLVNDGNRKLIRFKATDERRGPDVWGVQVRIELEVFCEGCQTPVTGLRFCPSCGRQATGGDRVRRPDPLSTTPTGTRADARPAQGAARELRGGAKRPGGRARRDHQPARERTRPGLAGRQAGAESAAPAPGGTARDHRAEDGVATPSLDASSKPRRAAIRG